MTEYKKYQSLSRVKKVKKKRKVIKRNVIIALSIILLVFTITGFVYSKINSFTDEIYEPPIVEQEPSVNKDNGDNNDNEENSEIEEELKFEDKSYAVLLIGLDYRPETGTCNTDTLIISIINPVTNKVSLLSIPRDTRVNVPDHGYVKVNSVYAMGEHVRIQEERNNEQVTMTGPSLLMETLSNYFDIPISYYVKVDFQGFKTIVDELGGIEVYVDRNMYYSSESDGTYINLRRGLQILDGENALDFARFRMSSDGNDSNDFERNNRQQEVIKAFVDELVSLNGITKVFNILDIAASHIKTNINSEELTSLFMKYKGISTNDIETIHMESYWENPYVRVDQSELTRIINILNDALDIVEDD